MSAAPLKSSRSRSAATRATFWSAGFRPFYFFAAIFSVVTIACWVAQSAGWTGSRMYLAGPLWHAHEMLFGYAFAVIAGFLFTAVRTWTNQATPSGRTLALIAGLWLAGRVLVLTPWFFLAALTDTAFAVAVAAGIAVPLIRSHNQRNYFFIVLILALGAVNLGFYLAMAGWIHFAVERGMRIGIDLVLLLMVVVAGRVIPMFTANAVRGAKPRRVRWLDWIAMTSVLVLLAADVLVLPAFVTKFAAGIAAATHLTRLVLWQPWLTLSRPILWILHVSYAWIVAYLALRALAAVDRVPISLAIHALTVGAIGGLTVGMMTRTARGHTGRALEAGKLEVACYVLIQLAAVTRVFLPFFMPRWYPALIIASGALWAAAFAVLIALFAHMFLRLDKRSV